MVLYSLRLLNPQMEIFMSCLSVSKFFSENCNCHSSSALPKALSLIPVVGSIVQLIQEKSILWSIKISHALDNTKETIELVKLKNEYKVLAIVNSVICLAAIVTMAALGVLSPIIACFTIAGYGFVVGLNTWNIYQNKKAIELLNDPKPINITIR